MSSPSPPDDPFTTLLTLEDTLYTTAYTAGSQAGSLAGKTEGRIFGLEKGFEKYAALGMLHGRACVWGARIGTGKGRPVVRTEEETGTVLEREDHATQTLPSTSTSAPEPESATSIKISLTEQHLGKEQHPNPQTSTLPPLPPSTRLIPHITTLHALSDPLTFSTANTEESVADFDDRFKRAGAKAKVIERIVGESSSSSEFLSQSVSPSTANTSAKGGRSNVKLKGNTEPRTKLDGGNNIEDFTGSRFLN